MSQHRVTRSAALCLAIAAIAAPAASAQQQDLRSPDARDVAVPARIAVDLRSPDARDLAAGRGTFSVPQTTFVKVPQQPAPSSDGIDWGDAGIGAGLALCLFFVALGSVAVTRRRHGAAI
jgi:hypothetical protein